MANAAAGPRNAIDIIEATKDPLTTTEPSHWDVRTLAPSTAARRTNARGSPRRE
jgi:hypothetical protein